jgi:hypothetical protein
VEKRGYSPNQKGFEGRRERKEKKVTTTHADTKKDKIEMNRL